jgi:hypothetical protein
MHVLCDEFFARARLSIIYCLRPFVLFIRDFDGDLTPSSLQDPDFTIKFWNKFILQFFVGKYDEGNGARVSTLADQWGQFTLLVKQHFIPGGLVADSARQFPVVQGRGSIPNKLRIRTRKDGEQIHNKLLTEIPLLVSDSEAIHLLFRVIDADLRAVREWASHQVDEVWNRYLRRCALAASGTPVSGRGIDDESKGTKEWLVSRENPEHLAHAAATLTTYGFLTPEDQSGRGCFPRPLTQTAFELALPITDALLPHCFVLVDAHPAITPSFLESFELFNKDGKRTGFVEGDEGAVLVGFKRRKGAELAQQDIVLSELTTVVVRQMIALTNPLRNYLRERNDDNWRYLLLTCQRAFASPTRVTRLATATSAKNRRENTISQMGAVSPTVSEDKIRDLVRRLSLPAVRASAGVLTYLKTHSVHQMAEALGHDDYSPRLLDRYLPKCIREFFQERWVRLFQNGLILQAMRGSKHLVRASDFTSLEEVDTFLTEHALRLPSDSSDAVPDSQGEGKVVFGLNVEILTVLLSLSLAVEESEEEVSDLAQFWSQATIGLVNHIEAGNTGRPDIEGYLRRARKLATAVSMREMVRRV